MPLPPNLPVPHIVGEDDPEIDNPISPDRRLETDSCLSDSSYEDDDTEDDSSSSDGADWSMNVTRIAATPGRVPIYAATPLMKSAVVVEERMQSPILANEDTTLPISEMEVEMEEPSFFTFLNLHPTSQVTTNVVDMDTGDLEEQVPTSSTSSMAPPPKPGTSRNSGKARAAAQTQTVRNLRSASGTMPRRVYASAGRVDARPGRLDARPGRLDARPGRLDARPGRLDARPVRLDARSGRVNAPLGRILRIKTTGTPNNTVAKPLEVTSYFRVVSAYLVRSRVKENAFQVLRKMIDRHLLATSDHHSLRPNSGRYSC